MADIRLATDFFDHPKTMMLQAKHGAESVLCLQRLWCWAANNRSKGALRGIDKKAIALVARCADEVVDTFIELGFIDEHSRGYTLHNWKKNQGYVYHSEERSDKARKAAKARHAPKSLDKDSCSEHASSNAQTESEQGYGDAPAPDPVPDPSPDPVPTPNPPLKIKTSSPKATPPEAYDLASRLGRWIYKRDPKNRFLQEETREDTFQRWGRDIDLAIRIDKRTHEEVEKIIDWCQQDEFWRDNILSGVKLREQFDQLNLKMLSATTCDAGNEGGQETEYELKL